MLLAHHGDGDAISSQQPTHGRGQPFRPGADLATAGAPHRVHWGLPDPAAVTGRDEARRGAFRACFESLEARIQQLALGLDAGRGRSALYQWMNEHPPGPPGSPAG